jgi:GNAT superfamily N-acetyltransferase
MFGKMKWHNEGFWISDDPSEVDTPAVHRLLSTTYWAAARPKKRTERGVTQSVCFSLKKDDAQIGFARVLTDDGCYAVVVDVVIDPRFQRKGLGGWLMTIITSYSRFEGMVLILWTADQVDFYKACGLSHLRDFAVMRKAPAWMKKSRTRR